MKQPRRSTGTPKARVRPSKTRISGRNRTMGPAPTGYSPKGTKPKVTIKTDTKAVTDPKRGPKRTKIDPKNLPGGGTTVNPGVAPRRPKRTGSTRGPIKPGGIPNPTRGPKPKPKSPQRPTRPTRRRPTGGMDAIRRGVRRGSQR